MNTHIFLGANPRIEAGHQIASQARQAGYGKARCLRIWRVGQYILVFGLRFGQSVVFYQRIGQIVADVGVITVSQQGSPKILDGQSEIALIVAALPHLKIARKNRRNTPQQQCCGEAQGQKSLENSGL